MSPRGVKCGRCRAQTTAILLSSLPQTRRCELQISIVPLQCNQSVTLSFLRLSHAVAFRHGLSRFVGGLRCEGQGGIRAGYQRGLR
eukprot:1960099-Pleurochrysis_carterae.AAC.1